MKNKLCIVYNFAPHYRKGIFTLLDKEYDCSWYFGDQNTDIKPLDMSLLREAQQIHNLYVAGSYYYNNAKSNIHKLQGATSAT